MNGVTTNGVSKPLSNGVLPRAAIDGRMESQSSTPQATLNGFHGQADQAAVQSSEGRKVDGQHAQGQSLANGFKQMPPEIQHITQGYLSLSKLIQRSAQECWNGLADVVERLSEIPLSAQSQMSNGAQARTQSNGTGPGDQTKENVDKKDQLLHFAQDQRASFIKLLVLAQWGKSASDIQNVIDLHSWMVSQRIHYTAAADFIGYMKRDLALAQIPNPDLTTALEVLSSQRASGFPDLGYVPQKMLKPKRMLKTIKRINTILCSRLTLDEILPPAFDDYHVHDGRVTFSIPAEFELDLSIADEDVTSQFYFIDFRFTFEPSTNILDGRLHDEVAGRMNGILKTEGLRGCYNFLHDLTLSYKISVLYKQATELARGQWSENLRIEMIHRTLTMQYWTNRPAGKSWIEIGIKRKQRIHGGNLPGLQDTHLNVRWVKEKKLIEDAEIEIDPQNLSAASILQRVTALHAGHILDSTYEKLMKGPIYRLGHLLLELSISSFESSNCILQLQLTETKRLSLSLETVSGAIVLKPASATLGRVEHDLNRSKNIVDDASQRLLHLRCTTAERDLTDIASSAGWQILRAFKPSAVDLKSLFDGRATRHVFLRQAAWEPGFMLAATQSLEEDRYWLVHAKDVSQPETSQLMATSIARLTSEAGFNDARQKFMQLSRYSSGCITLRVNAFYLNSLSIRNVLADIPQFAPGYTLPNLSFDFQPAKLRHVVNAVSTSVDWTQDSMGLEALEAAKESWLRETVSISFYGLDPESQNAIVLAKGRSNAPTRTLEYIQGSITDPATTLKPNTGEFTIRLMSAVGTSIIDQLLDRLLQLETLIACVTTITKHTTIIIKEISPFRAIFTYQMGPSVDLGVIVNFATAASPLYLEFMPEGQNPHIRVASQLTQHLTRHEVPLYTNLSSFIPMLRFTLPLLSVFDELQSCASVSSSDSESTSLRQSVRVHIFPRGLKMYGIQYFGPSLIGQLGSDLPVQTSMLARFEILPLEGKIVECWVLRPAIEEYESYTRESYCSQALKKRLRADVFGKRELDQGWRGLDTGATCAIERPERLLKRVDEVIRAWVKEAGERPPRAIPVDEGNMETAIKGPVKNVQVKSENAPVKNGQAKPNSASAKNEQARLTNVPAKAQHRQTGSNNQAKGNVNGVGTGKVGAQKAKEVITLD